AQPEKYPLQAWRCRLLRKQPAYRCEHPVLNTSASPVVPPACCLRRYRFSHAGVMLLAGQLSPEQFVVTLDTLPGTILLPLAILRGRSVRQIARRGVPFV